MEITCPYSDCGKKFDWKPPNDTDVYKMLTAEALKEKKTRRYVITCPGCKRKISVYV